MKYPQFEALGRAYPYALEEKYERILRKIAALWCSPEIDDYFTSLILDTRGGRQGFPMDVLADISRLREFHESERFRAPERRADAVKELEQHGVPFKLGLFFRAVEEGHQDQVDLFVRAGINLRAVDEQGTPPLITALKKGYTVIARILLIGGADPNARDKIGLTPLLLACGKSTHGYQEIAERLIYLGADVNVKDRLGWTPLLLALSGGTVEVAEMLIEKGANVWLRAPNGKTAIDMAELAGRSDLVQLMLEKNAGHL